MRSRQLTAFPWGDTASLFGEALDNAGCSLPYPGWRVRFCGWQCPSGVSGLPARTWWRRDKGVQPDGQSQASRLCWRFQVANRSRRGAFFGRDADLRRNLERLAVDDRLASGRWFHMQGLVEPIIDPVLAGHVGGGRCAASPCAADAAISSSTMETPNIDQWFLRLFMRHSRQSARVHDRCFNPPGAVPWPQVAPPGNEHVGQDLSGPGISRPFGFAPGSPVCRVYAEDNDGTEETDLGGGGRHRERTGDIFIAKRSADRHQGIAGSFPVARWSRGRICSPRWTGNWGRSGSGCGLCPFMELHHDYPDKQVLLDIWKVTRFHGEPFGRRDRVPLGTTGLAARIPLPGCQRPHRRAVAGPC